MNQIVDYRKKYPLLFKKQKMDTGLIKTLKDLGLKPDQAVAQGFVQVAPSVKNGPISFPSYWVASENFKQFERLIENFTSKQHEITQIKNKNNIKALFKAEIPFEILTSSLFYPLEQWVDSAFSEDIPQFDSLNLLLTWYLIKKCDLNISSVYTGKKVFVHKDNVSFEFTFNQFFEELFSGELVTSILHRIADKNQEAEVLYQQWLSTKPVWFDGEALKSWVYSKTWHPNSATSHPLVGHTAYGILMTKSNMFFKEINKSLTISCHDAICHAAWRCSDIEELIKNKKTILQNVGQSEMDKLIFELSVEESSGFLLKMGISDQDWRSLVLKAISKVCTSKFNPEDQKPLIKHEIKEMAKEAFNQHCAERCKKELPKHIKDYYPLARAMGRELIFIVGPTNSGKTYQAIQELAKSESGVYLGPLRLLALEIRDTLMEGGVLTSLVTGEQVESVPGAMHTSSTIEMLNFSKKVDVAVIDEVQTIGDSQRGSAWLHAILGVPAKKVFLIGSPECKDVILSLVQDLKEKITIIEKDRLNALRVIPRVTPYSAIPDQSAIIAFSRKDVLLLAQKLKTSGRTVAVIYGSLPPEVRRQQSELFSSGKAEVLVATDAIGLGLNLPISAIYFTTGEKWNGKEIKKVDPHLVWQIAGRAGRYGHFEEGLVGAIDSDTLSYIKACLSKRPEVIDELYYCNLTYPIAEKIADQIDSDKLEHILTFYSKYMQLQQNVLTVITEEQVQLAKILDKYPLNLAEKLLLSNAPAISGKYPDSFYEEFVKCIAKNVEFPTLNYIEKLQKYSSLQDLESRIKSLSLYSWMHYRFPHIFLYMQNVRAELTKTNNDIAKKLAQKKMDI